MLTTDVLFFLLQMETWLGGTLNAMKNERSSERDLETLRTRAEALYRQKQTHEPEMEAIKTTARDLIDDPSTCDKHAVRDTLSGVQEKWNDMTERLVNMISYSVSDKCDLSRFQW